MSKVKVRTLTPLHIGTGVEWQENYEYIHFREKKCLAVIDPEKVLAVIGEENLYQWVACIERRESLLPMLQQRHPNLQPEDIAHISIGAAINPGKPLRAQMRSGAIGCPMLPGSSLKGALRTAVFAKLVLDNYTLAHNVRYLGRQQGSRFIWSSNDLEKIFFGNDPNQDIFRLLQPADVHFSGVKTRAYTVDTINKYRDEYRIKRELTQCVEAIPAGAVASGRFNYNKFLEKAGVNLFGKNAPLLQTNKLFPIVNNHTLRIVKEEIEYWDNDQDNPEPLGDYVDEMRRIQKVSENCSENECVIRIGWGSGFRSITGDWHREMNENDYDNLLRTIRPRHPVELTFPKSMRFVQGGVPLGFVKLTIN